MQYFSTHWSPQYVLACWRFNTTTKIVSEWQEEHDLLCTVHVSSASWATKTCLARPSFADPQKLSSEGPSCVLDYLCPWKLLSPLPLSFSVAYSSWRKQNRRKQRQEGQDLGCFSPCIVLVGSLQVTDILHASAEGFLWPVSTSFYT